MFLRLLFSLIMSVVMLASSSNIPTGQFMMDALPAAIHDGAVVVSQTEDKKAVSIEMNLSSYMDSWSDDLDGQYFYDMTGKPLSGWVVIDGNRYYLNKDGQAHTGWFTYHNMVYCFDDMGQMIRGFAERSIQLQIVVPVTRPRPVTVLNDDAITYYFDNSGVMHRGWLSLDGERYYFDPNGVMHYGWLDYNDNWYYLDDDGKMHVGWLQDEENTYYFTDDGTPAVGLTTIEDASYYFDEHAILQTGWKEIDGSQYHFGEDGKMISGWFSENGFDYYFTADGKMVTGFTNIDGKLLYFDVDGHWHTGHTYVGSMNGFCYLYDTGGYAIDELVNGHYYGPNGVAIEELYTADYYIHNGAITYFNTAYNGIGRFYVPDAGISVALYEHGYHDRSNPQAITDAKDSACYLTGWGNVPMIADHYNQGFDALYNAYSGMKAFIRRNGQTYVYSCYYVALGSRDEYYCYDAEGRLIWNGNDDDIVCYTCYNGWRNIYVIKFSLVEVL